MLSGVFQETLPTGSTLIPIILYSDKTKLTPFGGNKSAWPVYMTIGNIKSDVRNRVSSHAWVPIAYLPVIKFSDNSDLNGLCVARFYHQCMAIVMRTLLPVEANGVDLIDSGSNIRHCFTRIGVYMADYPEQCLINCVGYKSSPNFDATSSDLGDDTPGDVLTYDLLMTDIRSLWDEYEELSTQNMLDCLKRARKIGLSGVLHPWWEHHVGYQP